MSTKQTNFCLLGSGIWGTALAIQITRVLGGCTIFTKNPDTLYAINNHHNNKGAQLPAEIRAEIDYSKLAEYQNIILAAPSYALYDVLPALKSLPKEVKLLVATKGLDTQKNQLISQTLQSHMVNEILILSGASFANEVIDNQPTIMNLAADNFNSASQLAKQLNSDHFLVIPSDNMVALQLAGCIKNVIAIFSGILTELGYGQNICSSVIAKGIQESQALSNKINPNGKFEAISLFSDIIMTCSSSKSRNMSFGRELALGKHAAPQLTEGALAIDALLRLAQKRDIALPLIQLASTCIKEPQNIKEQVYFNLMKVF